MVSAPAVPVRTSSPVEPLIWKPALVTVVMPDRSTVAAAAALTITFSRTPPAVPATVQVLPVIWAPVKVASAPSARDRASMLVKATVDRSVVAVRRTVSVSAPPSTVSPAPTSAVPLKTKVSLPAPPAMTSIPALPVMVSVPRDPVRFSAPAAPTREMPALVTAVKVDRSTVAPDAALTTRVSAAPPATPVTVQAWPVTWAPVKVAVWPLAMDTPSMFSMTRPVRSVVAVTSRVSTPEVPSTVSPAETSEVPPKTKTSSPMPPTTLSAPTPPLRVSFPVSPNRVSFPPRPWMDSLPVQPVMNSSPPPPTTRTATPE